MSEQAVVVARSRRVLDLAVAPQGDSSFVFWQLDEDTGLATTVLKMTERSWRDLGSPTQVTLTIEPGDSLNS